MAPTLTREERPGGLTLGLGLARYGPPRPISPEVMSSPGLWAGCKGMESLSSGHPLGLVLSLGPSPARELCAMADHRGTLKGTDRPPNDLRDKSGCEGARVAPEELVHWSLPNLMGEEGCQWLSEQGALAPLESLSQVLCFPYV